MSESMRDLLAREAAEAEAVAEAEERGVVAPQRGQRGRRRSEDPSQVYAVRIPVSRLNELRELAESLGEAPSALIRQWVIERLDAMTEKTSEEGCVIAPVARLGADSLAPGEVRLGACRQQVVVDPQESSRRRQRA